MEKPQVHTHGNKTLYIQSERGKWYVIYPNGDIQRTDMLHEPSGQWTMLGLVGDGGFTPLHLITPEWRNGKRLRKYRIRDFDHGTLREWGDTIDGIAFYDRPEDTPYFQYVRDRLLREAGEQERIRTAKVYG
jgi:hypothetical protein